MNREWGKYKLESIRRVRHGLSDYLSEIVDEVSTGDVLVEISLAICVWAKEKE